MNPWCDARGFVIIESFTGTPLLKKDKKKSLEVFGPYIHTYKYDEAREEREGAADLLVYLVSGMMFMLETNEAPRQAQPVGGILRWKDGRNMPDVCGHFLLRRTSGLHAAQSKL